MGVSRPSGRGSRFRKGPGTERVTNPGKARPGPKTGTRVPIAGTTRRRVLIELTVAARFVFPRVSGRRADRACLGACAPGRRSPPQLREVRVTFNGSAVQQRQDPRSLGAPVAVMLEPVAGRTASFLRSTDGAGRDSCVHERQLIGSIPACTAAIHSRSPRRV